MPSYSLRSFQIEKSSVRDSSVAYKIQKKAGELRGNLKDGLKSEKKEKKERIKSQGRKRERYKQRKGKKNTKIQHSAQKRNLVSGYLLPRIQPPELRILSHFSFHLNYY